MARYTSTGYDPNVDPSTALTPNHGNPAGLTFAPTAAALPPALPGSAPAASPSSDPFSLFSDPSTNFLTHVIQGQLGTLATTPATDPTTGWLQQFLTSQIGSLSGGAPTTFSAGNPLMGPATSEIQQRIAELNQAPFSSAQEDALRTSTRNDLATQRDQANQRLIEEASARGVAPSSGIIGAEQAQLEKGVTAQDAKNQNDLMLWIAQQTQDRKNQAAGLAGTLAQIGDAQANRDLSAQEAGVSADQNKRAMVLSMANGLANLMAQQRGEARARQGDVLSLASMLAELPIQRLTLASNILNGSTPNPGSIFNDVNALNTAQTNATNQQTGATANWLNGLAQYAGYLSTTGAF